MTASSLDDQYREMVELETVLDDLSQSPGWQVMETRARETLNAQTRRLLSGEVDPAEYQKLAWQIRGSEWILTGILADTRMLLGELKRQLAEIEKGQEG